MSIEEHRYGLIHKILTTASASIYMSMDPSRVLEDSKDGNGAFVAKVIQDSYSVQLFRGRPQFVGREYVKEIPPPPRSDAELLQPRETVRASLYSLIQHCWAAGNLEVAYAYCSFLAEFDKSHYNHFVWLGRLAGALGRPQVAKESYEQALAICRADKDWPRESLDELIASFEKEAQGL